MTLSHRQHLENHYKHGEIHFKSVVSMIKSLIKRLQIRRSVRANQPHSPWSISIISFSGSLCEVYHRQFFPRKLVN